MSQLHPNVSLHYVGLRRPITSILFHKCIATNVHVSSVSSLTKIDGTSGRTAFMSQKHWCSSGSSSAKGWSWRALNSMEFFCGWERETWAPTEKSGVPQRHPLHGSTVPWTFNPASKNDRDCNVDTNHVTQSQTKFDSGLKVPHFKVAEVQQFTKPCGSVSVCFLSADGNERQVANLYGVPQRHPFTMMTWRHSNIKGIKVEPLYRFASPGNDMSIYVWCLMQSKGLCQKEKHRLGPPVQDSSTRLVMLQTGHK